MENVNLVEYRILLERLKKNREHVPLSELQEKYARSYNELEEKLRMMTVQLIQNAVFNDLLLERIYSGKAYQVISEVVKESGILAEIGHAAYLRYDPDEVLEYAEELRELVHNKVREIEEHENKN